MSDIDPTEQRLARLEKRVRRLGAMLAVCVCALAILMAVIAIRPAKAPSAQELTAQSIVLKDPAGAATLRLAPGEIVLQDAAVDHRLTLKPTGINLLSSGKGVATDSDLLPDGVTFNVATGLNASIGVRPDQAYVSVDAPWEGPKACPDMKSCWGTAGLQVNRQGLPMLNLRDSIGTAMLSTHSGLTLPPKAK